MSFELELENTMTARLKVVGSAVPAATPSTA
jgi:hypothetical protein